MTRSGARRTAGAAAVAVFVMNGFGVVLPVSAASADSQNVEFAERSGPLEPGDYDVQVRYDTIGAADVTLDVNSHRLVVDSVPAAGEWSITTRVHLDGGVNEITVGSSTGLWLSEVTTTPVSDDEAESV